MGADLLRELIGATLASSAAVLLIAPLSKRLRAAAGARIAYGLWLLVPAFVIASFLPAPDQVLHMRQVSLPGPVGSALATVVSTAPRGAWLQNALISLWAAGACGMFVLLVMRQRKFIRSLGTLVPDPNGFHRSDAVAAPMLVGAWRPKIVVPQDFESRYSEEERELVLSHERAHLLRRDVTVNAVAMGWLCVFWFNPLIYWAISRLRADQELACDAQVLARHAGARRSYANALLKTQLATESGWRMPVGCHWQSSHSLKERIVMLKRPLPGVSRRVLGIAGIAALIGTGSYAAWAAQTPVAGEGPSILVSMRVTVTTTTAGATDTYAAATQYLVRPGEPAPHMGSRPHDFGCTPYLTDVQRQQLGGEQAQQPAKGMILLDCIVRYDGEVVATSAVLAFDGEQSTIETADRDGIRHYKIELTASTSAERIAAAKTL